MISSDKYTEWYDSIKAWDFLPKCKLILALNIQKVSEQRFNP